MGSGELGKDPTPDRLLAIPSDLPDTRHLAPDTFQVVEVTNEH